MHEKNIKRMVVKQVKQKYPNWKKVTRKKKKALAREVLDEVVSTRTKVSWHFRAQIQVGFGRSD